MSQTLPFHSIKATAPNVFHNNDVCQVGERIERQHWRAGDGERPICAVCVRLNADEVRERPRAAS